MKGKGAIRVCSKWISVDSCLQRMCGSGEIYAMSLRQNAF